jgi:predicted RNase H-like nuclease
VVPATGTAYVGIDLAWGNRARTGLAVAAPDGRLLASCAVRTDEQIIDFLRRHAPDSVVAAIDAPLIVRNPSGRRDCEAQVQRRFGRYGAGPYPANLGNPAFADGTRAGRLCTALGFDMYVDSAAPRRAVEVYPHPAMVVLLELERVIPYKNKAGRSLESLHGALGRLLDLMETRLTDLQLASSSRWVELRALAANASRKADLDQIEDEVDAIFCAHLAHRWQRDGRAGNDVFGDDAGGAIVVPRS